MIITGGKFKGRKIQVPDEKITRPTLSKVRQGVFNALFSLVDDFNGKIFVDLFGGSGVMGLEALSRGFKNVIVCEKNMKAVQIIKKNYSELGLKPELKIGDSLTLIDRVDKNVDVVYIDPPYYSGIYETIFEKIKLNQFFQDSIDVVEHSEPLKIEEFELIKEKNYGGKLVSFCINSPSSELRSLSEKRDIRKFKI